MWCRVVVASDLELPKVANVLERAIGWEGYHLHLFDVGGVLFAIPGEDADYPIDEEHQHLVSWAPEEFDPAAFDLVGANRRLRGRSPDGRVEGRQKGQRSSEPRPPASSPGMAKHWVSEETPNPIHWIFALSISSLSCHTRRSVWQTA